MASSFHALTACAGCACSLCAVEAVFAVFNLTIFCSYSSKDGTNIFATQRCHIRLRAAQVPEQFVIVSQLCVAFACHNLLMFLARDAALFFELNSRPLSFGNDRL